MVKLEIAGVEDFPRIYKDMTQQFPESELKSREDFVSLLHNNCYKLILASDNEKNIGYIIVFQDKTGGYLWLDYIAVFGEYHSKGFGGQMLGELKNLFCDACGIFLEVEKPDENVPATLRRIKFYQKHGAELVNNNYLYPNAAGFLPMDLYYIPYSGKLPEKEDIFNVIQNVFDVLHQNLEHKDYVYDLIVNESGSTNARKF